MNSPPLTKTSVAAFISWTASSFICHWAAKRYITIISGVSPGHSLESAVVLTLIQCLTCLVVVNISSSFGGEGRNRQIAVVKIVCHILATFSTNYSMTFMNAAATFTIKLLEPVTSAIAQYAIQGIALPTPSLISLPVIIYGALLFTGNPTGSIFLSMGTLLAFLSNIILAVRNVAISSEHKNKAESRIRSILFMFFGFVFIASLMTIIHNTMNPSNEQNILLCMFAALSGIFHVVYSYISTNVILKIMTVLNHSLLNILKRLLVVMLLYMVGTRQASIINWCGLLVCVIGLFINLYGKYFKRGSEIIGARLHSWRAAMLLTLNVYNIDTLQRHSFGLTFSGVDHIRYAAEEDWKHINIMTDSPFVIDSLKHNANTTPTDIPVNHSISYQLFFDHSRVYLPESVKLTTRNEIIEYAQSFHHSLFVDLLQPYKYVLIIDAAVHENKGDPAITVGEMILLKTLNKTLLYYCHFGLCTEPNLKYALSLIKPYPPHNVAIMLHGGGNIMGWVMNDKLRSRVFRIFQGYHFFLFPQSFFMTDDAKHLSYCEHLYRNQANFTMIMRDMNSLMLAKKHFRGLPNLLMAPDMAFQIGPINRFLKPFYDILWIQRTDKERSISGDVPALPGDITIKRADWLQWPTPHSKINMETAYLIMNNGLIFLQRGKVVITDRLHGHILSLLLDIPHVIINNKWNKIGNYHNTWTRGIQNTRVANNASHAVSLAIGLLHEYAAVLPQKVPYMSVVDKQP